MLATNLSRTALAAALIATCLVPTVPAQYGVFGSQVKVGDPDMLPLTKNNGVALFVNEADFGEKGVAKDNCLIIKTGAPASPGAQNKDLRLTPCQGHAAGSLITDADTTERLATYARRAVTVQYADLNSDGKYSAGEPVFVTTSAGGSLVATTSTGTFTVRLLTTVAGKAGSFLLAGDPELAQFGSATRLLPDGPSLVERDDKQWYLVLRSTGPASTNRSIPKGSPVPLDSIRLGGPPADMADVKPTSLTILTAEPMAQKDVQAVVDLTNAGKVAGVGLLVTKIDGVLVDARLSPVLGPGETSKQTLTFLTPAKAGPVQVKVNDIVQVLTLGGGAGVAGTDLQTRLASLEARLAALERAPSIAAQSVDAKPQAAGVDGLLTVALLGLALLALRRRAP